MKSLLLILGVHLAAFTSTHATVLLSETFESETVGSGTYTSDWKFVYADPNLGLPDPQSPLDIENGALAGGWGPSGAGPASLASPAGGNYLGMSVPYYGRISEDFPSSGASSTGHFYRKMTLDAGTTYEVSLWREIQTDAIASSGGGGGDNRPAGGFSIWSDTPALDIVNPYDNSPSNLIGRTAYDFTTGGWQQVQMTFTTPGSLGDAPVDIAFMMGIYEPATPIPSTPGFEWTYEQSRYFLDDFTVAQVPEPSVALLTPVLLSLGLFRRSRPRSA